jgi:hypothetical protein
VDVVGGRHDQADGVVGGEVVAGEHLLHQGAHAHADVFALVALDCGGAADGSYRHGGAG